MTKMRECPLTVGAKQMATGGPSANLHFGRRLLDTRILVCLALIHHTTIFILLGKAPLLFPQPQTSAKTAVSIRQIPPLLLCPYKYNYPSAKDR